MDRTELGKMLLELVEQETGEKYPNLDDAADLRQNLKLDSLDMVSLVLRIESGLKIEIDSDELGQVATVGNLLDLLQQKVEARDGRQAA
jgi:acyl carrier protein